MYAVIESGGKQYRVSEGDVIRVERLACDEGAVVEFDKVLLVAGDGLDSAKVGRPHVEGATVSGKVLRQGKARKVVAFRYKPKKNVRVRKGHRQPFTEVEITGIKI
jgi:large subunit ribosomal protein L21